MKYYIILFGAGLFQNAYCGCNSCKKHKESQSNPKQKSKVKIGFYEMDKKFVDEANKRYVALAARVRVVDSFYRRNKEFTIGISPYIGKTSATKGGGEPMSTDDSVIQSFIACCTMLEKDNDWKLRDEKELSDGETIFSSRQCINVICGLLSIPVNHALVIFKDDNGLLGSVCVKIGDESVWQKIKPFIAKRGAYYFINVNNGLRTTQTAYRRWTDFKYYNEEGKEVNDPYGPGVEISENLMTAKPITK